MMHRAPVLLVHAAELRRAHTHAVELRPGGRPGVALFARPHELRRLRVAYALARFAPRLPLPA
jgi:hypothetical protein